jgi:hypothetical protein
MGYGDEERVEMGVALTVYLADLLFEFQKIWWGMQGDEMRAFRYGITSL